MGDISGPGIGIRHMFGGRSTVGDADGMVVDVVDGVVVAVVVGVVVAVVVALDFLHSAISTSIAFRDSAVCPASVVVYTIW